MKTKTAREQFTLTDIRRLRHLFHWGEDITTVLQIYEEDFEHSWLDAQRTDGIQNDRAKQEKLQALLMYLISEVKKCLPAAELSWVWEKRIQRAIQRSLAFLDRAKLMVDVMDTLIIEHGKTFDEAMRKINPRVTAAKEFLHLAVRCLCQATIEDPEQDLVAVSADADDGSHGH